MFLEPYQPGDVVLLTEAFNHVLTVLLRAISSLVTPTYKVPLRLLASKYTYGCVSIAAPPFLGVETSMDSRIRGHDEHYASSVTRSTSSIVVSPASALTMPSSYMVRMPA